MCLCMKFAANRQCTLINTKVSFPERRGLTWIAFSLHERQSAPDVLTRIVVINLKCVFTWHVSVVHTVCHFPSLYVAFGVIYFKMRPPAPKLQATLLSSKWHSMKLDCDGSFSLYNMMPFGLEARKLNFNSVLQKLEDRFNRTAFNRPFTYSEF